MPIDAAIQSDSSNLLDLFSGRCRVAVKYMRKCGLSVNDAVLIQLPNTTQMFLCRVWPERMHPDCVEDEGKEMCSVFHFDALVSVDQHLVDPHVLQWEEVITKKLLSTCEAFSSCNTTVALCPIREMKAAGLVYVEVYIADEQPIGDGELEEDGRMDSGKFMELVQNSKLYRKAIQDHLRRKVVFNGCVLNIPGPDWSGPYGNDLVTTKYNPRFRISKTNPPNQFLKVTQATQLYIISPRTKNSSRTLTEHADLFSPQRVSNGESSYIHETPQVSLLTPEKKNQHNIKYTPNLVPKRNINMSPKSRKFDLDSESIETKYMYSEVGGLDDSLKKLEELILIPMEYPNVKNYLNVDFPKGVLLSGPPGVGKTLLVRTVVSHCQLHTKFDIKLFVINGAEVLSSSIGDGEKKLREIFASSYKYVEASPKRCAIIFMDEIDTLCPKREDNSSNSSSRIVAQLLTLMDGLHERGHVLVLGATNLPNSIDLALRRPGRFDREIHINAPDEQSRWDILNVHCRKIPLNENVDLKLLAKAIIGYVGADIAALCREASLNALSRFIKLKGQSSSTINKKESVVRSINFDLIGKEEDKPSSVALNFWEKQLATAWLVNPVPLWYFLFKKFNNYAPIQMEVDMHDFFAAMEVVGASSLRKDHLKLPQRDNSRDGSIWDEIGGQDEAKLRLRQTIEWPIKYPHTFKGLNLKPPRGILLHGPPGCSKTTLVKAAAATAGATFLHLSGADVYSPYFGDAEAAIRQIFAQARAALPAIIFFDEIDSVVSKRNFSALSSSQGSGGADVRVLSTLLNEMDGIESAEGLLVVGATNRPDMIDAALLRPGRFDIILYVDLPDEMARRQILTIHTKKMMLNDDVNLDLLAASTSLFSGAELESICREAAIIALRDSIHASKVEMKHFESAVRTIQPASTPESLIRYKTFTNKI